MFPEAAVILVKPVFRVVATPLELIEATVGSEEFQVTCEEISWMLPSVNVPNAANCSAKPRAMLGFAGVTVIDESMGAVTVSCTGLAVMLENDARMKVEPKFTAVASP